MRSMPICLIAWLVLAFGIAQAKPARLTYEPEDLPKLPRPSSTDLKGTAWFGKYLTTNRNFIFEPDGTLSYRLGTSPKIFNNRGAWRAEGKTIFFTVLTTVEFQGSLQDSDTIVGEFITKKTGRRTPAILKRTLK